MIKRCVEVSGGKAHISMKDGQLSIDGDERSGQIPIEDLGVLVISHPAVTYTHGALSGLAANNVAVVVCGADHHPAGILLSYEGHSFQAETIACQASADQRLKDRLWKDIISAKIENHAAVLDMTGKDGAGLRSLSKRVRHGDEDNLEGQAAQRYWRALFGKDFRRDRDGAPPNGLLNYGYMVLRAACARALCGAGLHPSLGIHHRNRYNAFALADDLMEPFRAMVDLEAERLWREGDAMFSKTARTALLRVLASPVDFQEQNSPLMNALQKSAASLRRALRGECKKVEFPKPVAPRRSPVNEEEDE